MRQLLFLFSSVIGRPLADEGAEKLEPKQYYNQQSPYMAQGQPMYGNNQGYGQAMNQNFQNNYIPNQYPPNYQGYQQQQQGYPPQQYTQYPNQNQQLRPNAQNTQYNRMPNGQNPAYNQAYNQPNYNQPTYQQRQQQYQQMKPVQNMPDQHQESYQQKTNDPPTENQAEHRNPFLEEEKTVEPAETQSPTFSQLEEEQNQPDSYQQPDIPAPETSIEEDLQAKNSEQLAEGSEVVTDNKVDEQNTLTTLPTQESYSDDIENDQDLSESPNLADADTLESFSETPENYSETTENISESQENSSETTDDFSETPAYNQPTETNQENSFVDSDFGGRAENDETENEQSEYSENYKDQNEFGNFDDEEYAYKDDEDDYYSNPEGENYDNFDSSMLPNQLGNSDNLSTSPEYHDTAEQINEDQFGDDYLFDTEKSTMDKMADMGFYLVAGSIVIILCYGMWTFVVKQYIYPSDADYENIPLTEKEAQEEDEENDEWSWNDKSEE